MEANRIFITQVCRDAGYTALKDFTLENAILVGDNLEMDVSR